MMYASEIRDFLAYRPGDKYCVRHLVRLVRPGAKGIEAERVRKQVRRVLHILVEIGCVQEVTRKQNGGHNYYAWIEKDYGLKIPR